MIDNFNIIIPTYEEFTKYEEINPYWNGFKYSGKKGNLIKYNIDCYELVINGDTIQGEVAIEHAKILYKNFRISNIPEKFFEI